MKEFINNHPILTTGIIFGAYSTILKVCSMFKKSTICYIFINSKKENTIKNEHGIISEKESPINQEV